MVQRAGNQDKRDGRTGNVPLWSLCRCVLQDPLLDNRAERAVSACFPPTAFWLRGIDDSYWLHVWDLAWILDRRSGIDAGRWIRLCVH